MSFDEAHLAAVQRAGYVRRRLFGGYRMTIKGGWYLRDACARHEALHAELSKQTERWESGAMTKRDRREALVELVLHGWELDRTEEAEAVAELRSQGFDPLPTLREFGLDVDDLDVKADVKRKTEQEE
jgi:hypothetical protein